MLLSRTPPQKDETLESFIIRTAQHNGYKEIDRFLGALQRLDSRQNSKVHSASSLKLLSINLYHAKTSGRSRLDFIRLFSHLIFEEAKSVNSLLLYRGREKFSGKYESVNREGDVYPRIFLQTSTIPVCTECLAEGAYIRQLWHFTPYNACHHHCRTLIHQCSCGHMIHYIKDQSINICPKCNEPYYQDEKSKAPSADLELARWLSGGTVEHLPDINKSHRWGILLWWLQFNHYNPDRYAQETSPDFILFLSGFPETFHHILDEKVNLAEDYSTKQLGALRFEDVFGNLLLTSTRLPSSKLKFNIILKYLISFFQDKFYSNNWLANLKLNAIEASILLNCNTQQVAALADQGILPIHNKRLINPLNIYTPAFELGDVFCVWMTKFQSEHSNLQVLTSKW